MHFNPHRIVLLWQQHDTKITAHSLTVYLSCKLYWSNYLKLPLVLLPSCCLCRSDPEVSTWHVNAKV